MNEFNHAIPARVNSYYKPAVCNTCKKQILSTSRRSTNRYSQIVTRNCGCGFTVDVIPKLDLDRCLSSHPLPGYDRDSMRAKLTAAGVLL